MDNYFTLPTKPKETFLQKFTNYVGASADIGRIVEGIAIVNANCQALLGRANGDIAKIPEDKLNELIEFKKYFDGYYGKRVLDHRTNGWGPVNTLAFVVAGHALEYKKTKVMLKIYDEMTSGEKNEVDTLAGRLFVSGKDRIISFMYDGERRDMEFSRVMPKQERDRSRCYDIIKCYTSKMIKERGSIIVKECVGGTFNEKSEVYGFTTNRFGVWSSLSAEDVETLYYADEPAPIENQTIVFTVRPRYADCDGKSPVKCIL